MVGFCASGSGSEFNIFTKEDIIDDPEYWFSIHIKCSEVCGLCSEDIINDPEYC